ncbi:MAG: valine--tRNA ligase [Verrucomicrobia bacterium]|nr:valine--tRNA ligase [Verrucomicrobiota bacterium]
MDIPKQYSAADVEGRIALFWQETHAFDADPPRGGASYCIVIPPPNVTATLHTGHALNNTLQDVLVRWQRMRGRNTRWVYGTDHAGIATQNVVERALAQEGIRRDDLTRDEFLERIWQWCRDKGGGITEQLKRLGCSLDYANERFTMDDGLSNAVQEVFIRLYDKGLIYRGNYIVNWCPRCRTALSDEEAEHREQDGKLWYIRYPIEGGKTYIVVATTRPETMLGDVAVAVNPADKRLDELRAKTIVLPILNRRLAVIADDFVDPKFGTGIVKVTPAHDPNDFQMGLRHGLDPVNVMTDTGLMNENAGPYAGMDRFVCRTQLLDDLDREGLIEKIEPHTLSIGECYRCHTVVEPRLSRQWFVRMKPLAEPCIKPVEDGAIRFHPKRWTKVYLEWMNNIRDWCISRQIQWGHRIPIYYVDGTDQVIAARSEAEAIEKSGGRPVAQDPDVLDTWFSSWLWPFSTLGWPEETAELKCHYPTNVLVTAPEIIFFWVARMIMAGYEFMGDLPFTDVVIHGTVRDEYGRKQSKSLRNGIDPLDIIAELGADALRFSIVSLASPGQDLPMQTGCDSPPGFKPVHLSDEERARRQLETFLPGRNFANKLWNASRFVLQNLEGADPTYDLAAATPSLRLSPDDVYILGKLNEAIAATDDALTRFRLNDAAQCLYEFFWRHYCDRYIEYAKGPLGNGAPEDKQRTQAVLRIVLENTLKLLHPIVPYITEEIWRLLNGKGRTPLMVSAWPKRLDLALDEPTVALMDQNYELIRAGRNLRKEYGVAPNEKRPFIVAASSDVNAEFLNTARATTQTMLGASVVDIHGPGYEPDRPMPSGVTPIGTIYIDLGADAAKELARLRKELDKLDGVIATLKKKLRNQQFLAKAPEEVVQKEREKLDQFSDKADRLRRSLAALEPEA